MKTIIVAGKEFIFEEEDINYDNNFAITQSDAKEILELTDKLFKTIGLDFYLAYGTLLGAIRDKGLIPGDEDVDLFIRDESILYNNLPYLYNNGLKLVRYRKGTTYSFRMNDKAYIDIYILKCISFLPWGFYCYSLSDMVTPKKYFKKYTSVNFLGLDCKCPENPEDILEFWYGKTWRTPVRGHKFYYEVKSAYYLRRIVKPFIQKLIGWYHWRHLLRK